MVYLADGVYYRFHALEVKKQETLESDYAPQPFIRRTSAANFTLPPSHCIRYVEWEWSPVTC